MLKILINAYACSPGMGSEPGMAWNWCVNLAKYCELYIITEGEFRNKIEIALPNLSQGSNMHFYYLPIGGDNDKRSEKIRKRCWNQGDWRFYIDYAKWQRQALIKAKEIVSSCHINVIHQLNMIGFREPGLLWQIENIPYIWGPTNAKEAFPVSYLQGAPLRSKMFIYLKNTITKYQLQYGRRVRSAVKTAAIVVAASTDSAKSINKYLNVNPIIINESGCNIVGGSDDVKKNNDAFNLLWVGRFIFTKQLILALMSLAITRIDKIQLHIVGGTVEEERRFKWKAQEMEIEKLCVWHGKVSHDRVLELMRQSDLFFFTSISEGTPHVILEAFNNNLPVLCFNTCGQGDCVTDEVGIKIPLTNPQQSVKDFAEKIKYLYHHREVLERMSQNCRKRAEELSWENKAKQMVELYEKVVQQKSNERC